MTETARRLRNVFLACLATASCSGEPTRVVEIGRNADSFKLTLQTSGIKGLCYAPQSVVPNGSLSLDGFDRPNSWKVVSTVPARVDGLRDILSAPRAKIGADTLTLSVPKDAVLKRPFDLQVVAFPCDAPQTVNAGMGIVQIVSITADLPPFAKGGTDGATSR